MSVWVSLRKYFFTSSQPTYRRTFRVLKLTDLGAFLDKVGDSFQRSALLDTIGGASGEEAKEAFGTVGALNCVNHNNNSGYHSDDEYNLDH